MTAVRLWLGKDVRRLAAWLVGWIALLALRASVASKPPDFWLVRSAVENLGAVATSALLVLLVVLVVHEDPPTDPAAFWPTRAVSGRQLFAAKAVFVALLLIVPATVVDLVEIHAVGGEPWVLRLAAVEVALEWTAWAAVALLLAALTRSIPEFIGAAVKVALVIALAWGALSVVGWHRSVSGGGASWSTIPVLLFVDAMERARHPEWWASLRASRTLALTVAVAALGFVAAGWTFVGRRPRVTWTAVAGGLVALVLLSAYWRWDFLEYGTPAGGAVAALPDGVQVRVDGAGRPLEQQPRAVAGATPQTTVGARLVTAGVLPPLGLEVVRMDGMLRYPGQRVHAIAQQRRGVFDAVWDLRAIEALLRVRLLGGGADDPDLHPLLEMPPEHVDAQRGARGELDLQVTLDVRRYRIVAELPLRAGARYERHGERFEIATVVLNEADCMVSAHGAQTALLLAGGRSTIRQAFFMRFDPDALYVLRNARRGEALLLEQRTAVGFGSPTRRRLDRISWVLPFRGLLPDGRRVIDDTWLDDADLVRVEASTEAQGVRRVVVNDFAIDPDAGADVRRTSAATTP